MSEYYEPEILEKLRTPGTQDPKKVMAHLVEDMLEHVNDRILSEFEDAVDAFNIKEGLIRMEESIEELHEEERNKETTEMRKRKRGQLAADMAAEFSDGKTPLDLTMQQSYTLRIQMKNDIIAEIDKIEKETANIREETSRSASEIEKEVTDMRKWETDMARTADLCTFGNT